MDGINVFGEASLGGQTFSYGQAWKGNNWPDNVSLTPSPYVPITSYGTGTNGFISIGTPWNVYKWVKENINPIPTVTTYYYFDSTGQCGEYDLWTLCICVYWYSGRVYFLATTHQKNTIAYTADHMRTVAGYTGADINNITTEDMQYFDVYFFQYDQSYLPDISNLYSGTDLSGQVLSVMNYELCNMSTMTYSKVSDMIMGDPLPMWTTYDPNVGYFGPNPVVQNWAYKVHIGTGSYAYKEWRALPLFMLDNLDDYTEETAQPGGGWGDFGYYTDSVDFAELPTIGAEDTGFTHMYAPTLQEVKDLAAYMWTDSFITNLKKLISTDPIKSIINFGFVPLDLTGVRGSAVNCVIGNIDTGVSMSPLTEQYIDVDMGYVDVVDRWGTALSFEPYTIIECYVPFVGFVQLPTSEIKRPIEEGKARIRLKYHVNLLTGDFIAELQCTCRQVKNVLFSHSGNMMYNIPLTGADYSSFYKNIIGAATRVIPAFLGSPAMGAASVVTGALSAATTPMQVQRSGTISGAGSVMSQFGAYLLIRQPRQHFDYDGHRAQVGFPSFLYKTLSSVHGYTKCFSIKLDGFTGTNDESAELEKLLKEGVYLP